jgi:hypothetical protein
VHASCEASRRGRRWFLGATAVLAGAAAAAPLLKLLPETDWLALSRTTYPAIITEIDPIAGVVTANVIATELERLRPLLPMLYEQDSYFVRRMMEDRAFWAGNTWESSRALRVPVALSPSRSL